MNSRLRISLCMVISLLLVALMLGLGYSVYATDRNITVQSRQYTQQLSLPRSSITVACPDFQGGGGMRSVFFWNTEGVGKGYFQSLDGIQTSYSAVAAIQEKSSGVGGFLIGEPTEKRNTQPLGISWAEYPGAQPGAYLGNCTTPANRFDFFTDSTAVGHVNELQLFNPSEKLVKVVIKAWSDRGPERLTHTVEVEAKSSKKVLVDGIFANRKRLFIQVTADSTGISAYLISSAGKGLEKYGRSIHPAAPPAATHLVIPAIDLGKGAELQVFNPGKSNGDFRVRLIGAKETISLQQGRSFKSASQAVFNLPLDGVDAGQYNLDITATVPLQAAVKLPVKTKDNGPTTVFDTVVKPAQTGIFIVPPGLSVNVVGNSLRTTTVRFKPISDSLQDAIKLTISPNKFQKLKLPAGVWQWESENSIVLSANYQMPKTGLTLQLPASSVSAEESDIKVAVQP